MKSFIILSVQILTLISFSACAVAQSVQKKEIIIVIDPGHGGQPIEKSKVNTLNIDRLYSSPNNAKTPDGKILEKDMTLELSKLIKDEIDRLGAASALKMSAILTRQGKEENPDMLMRAQVAARHNAASFVSIHFNASEYHDVRGPRAFVPGVSETKPKELRSNVEGEFAVELVRAVAKSLPESLKNKDIKITIGDEVQPEHQIPMVKMTTAGLIRGSHLFYQLRRNPATASIPACFLEIEFMDNPVVNDALLKDGKWKATFPPIAKAIAEQLISWHKEHP